jgi:hypothetical protein
MVAKDKNMLSLKKHITQLKNPFQTSNHQLALTVVSADDDELTQHGKQQTKMVMAVCHTETG